MGFSPPSEPSPIEGEGLFSSASSSGVGMKPQKCDCSSSERPRARGTSLLRLVAAFDAGRLALHGVYEKACDDLTVVGEVSDVLL